MPHSKNDQYGKRETEKRRDAAIKRALEMPAKPMAEYVGKPSKNGAPARGRPKAK